MTHCNNSDCHMNNGSFSVACRYCDANDMPIRKTPKPVLISFLREVSFCLSVRNDFSRRRLRTTRDFAMRPLGGTLLTDFSRARQYTGFLRPRQALEMSSRRMTTCTHACLCPVPASHQDRADAVPGPLQTHEMRGCGIHALCNAKDARFRKFDHNANFLLNSV